MRTLQHLPHATRLRPSKDGSVQLRMDGIDAPETHYGGQAQPLGAPARDIFLKACGFHKVDMDSAGTAVASDPPTRPATILVGLLDPYGRPVSYLLAGAHSDLAEGTLLAVGTDLLSQTVNVHMLATGAAYITLYNSTAPGQRVYLREVAAKAQAARLGVWAADTTAHFTLKNHASIGPDSGVLILPKLFRRCTDYLAAVDAGYAANLPSWVHSTAANTYHSEDDYVIREDGRVVPLHTLLHEQDGKVTTDLNILTDIFIEQ
jgi:endonuclease YncB( thermonuclease family)